MSYCAEIIEKIEHAQITPVTAAEVLSHLHLDGATEHEADLTAILRDAIDYVEAETDLVLCPSKWRWTLDFFPGCVLKLPVRPVLGVLRFRYQDTGGTWQDVDPTLYRLDGAASPPVLRLLPNKQWPTVLETFGAVELELQAGHNGLEWVPSQTKRAIKLLAGHWFANREAAAEKSLGEIAFSVSALLAQVAGREVV